MLSQKVFVHLEVGWGGMRALEKLLLHVVL